MTTLLAWLSRIGADPNDDVETRSRKALLVYLAVLIWPISLLWGTLYLSLGAPAGSVAFAYFVISVGSIGLFARTRNFELLLRIQLLDITLAPTLSMFPTAGILASGAVGLWGLLGPMGALVFSSVRSSIRWFVLFALAFLGAGIAGEVTGGLSTLPRWFSTTMLALNVVVGGAVVFTLLAVFARQRADAQDRAETLLLNILPALHRRQAEVHAADDRRRLRRRLRPVRRCRRLHAHGRARLPDPGGRDAGPAVRPLRHARRAVRGGEDQDDR